MRTQTEPWQKNNASIDFQRRWREGEFVHLIDTSVFRFTEFAKVCSIADKFNVGNISTHIGTNPRPVAMADRSFRHLLFPGNCDCGVEGRVPYKSCCRRVTEGNNTIWRSVSATKARDTRWNKALDDGQPPPEAICKSPNQYGGSPARFVTRCPEHLRVIVNGNGIVTTLAGIDGNGIKCGSGNTNCQENYRYTGKERNHNIPEVVRITASGKTPSRWEGCDRIRQRNTVCVVAMNKSRTVTVNFDEKPPVEEDKKPPVKEELLRNCERCSNVNTKKGCLIRWRDVNADGTLDSKCDNNFNNKREEVCPAPDSKELVKNCQPSCALTVERTLEQVNLNWTTTHGDRIVIRGTGIDKNIDIGNGTEGLHRFNNRGQERISAPTRAGTHTYTATVSNRRGNTVCRATLGVITPPAPPSGPPSGPPPGRIINSFTVNNNPFNSQSVDARLACLPRHDNNFNPLNPLREVILRWDMFSVQERNTCVYPVPTRPINPPRDECRNDDGAVFRPRWTTEWRRVINGGRNFCRAERIIGDGGMWWNDIWNTRWGGRADPLFEIRSSYTFRSNPNVTTDYHLTCQRERYTCQWQRNYVFYDRTCDKWELVEVCTPPPARSPAGTRPTCFWRNDCVRMGPCTLRSGTVSDGRIEHIPSMAGHRADNPAYSDSRFVTLVVVPKPIIEEFRAERRGRTANPLRILLNHYIDLVWRATAPSAGENISTELRCRPTIRSGDDGGRWEQSRSDQRIDNIFRRMFGLSYQGSINSRDLIEAGRTGELIIPKRTTEFEIRCRNVYYGREGATDIVCFEDSGAASVKVEVYRPELEEAPPTR
ncbi:MAG: hypothetical protein DDT42_01706 [candidate division WS2 bacterium]|uniref:Uncharacterized protein n=1 Tax=Psychracetigena formicireducens TaxID=2986056 RepID=A0A9E2F1U5_PSYF1|nr:hypothetical protein [Candidatus Psychracetigena formicireducens]